MTVIRENGRCREFAGAPGAVAGTEPPSRKIDLLLLGRSLALPKMDE